MNKLILCSLLPAILATPAVARDKEPPFITTAVVKDQPAVVLNKARAYILLRSDVAMPMELMRVPTADERARYDRMRAAAMAEAHAKYVKKFASYKKVLAKRDKGVMVFVPPKPVEPTEANFEFTAFERLASVSIGPSNRFSKDGASTYLQEVTPGEYRIYGPVTYAQNGITGTCYCMGSVKFEARAGVITDMGVIQSRLGRPMVKPVAGDSSQPVINVIPDFLGPAPASMPLDRRLASLPVVRAAYKPVGKLPNYYGVTLGRIPEMPGVMRYERDRIVDLTAGK